MGKFDFLQSESSCKWSKWSFWYKHFYQSQ